MIYSIISFSFIIRMSTKKLEIYIYQGNFLFLNLFFYINLKESFIYVAYNLYKNIKSGILYLNYYLYPFKKPFKSYIKVLLQ